MVLSKNWRCPEGELDLVVTDGRSWSSARSRPGPATTSAHRAKRSTTPRPTASRRLARRWRADHGVSHVDTPLRHRLGPLAAGRDTAGQPPQGRALMPLARAWSVALFGVDGVAVEIEADIGGGRPRTQIVGLPDASLNEAKERVRAAVRNSHRKWPDELVTLALSPAALPKGGSGYDVALACAVLVAAGLEPTERLEDTVLTRRTGPGRPNPHGARCPPWPAGRAEGGPAARDSPGTDAARGRAGHGPGRTGRGTPDGGPGLATRRTRHPPHDRPRTRRHTPTDIPDLADVIGQPEARWALEVAAAGGHHLLLTGPPGTGKTMLAQRLPGLLPEPGRRTGAGGHRHPLHRRPAVTRVAAGDDAAVHRPAPLDARCPRWSAAASGLAKPGAISTAHNGVLLLDEACEFADRPVGGAAHRAGGGRDPPGPPRRRGPLPGAVPVGAGHQPVPVRATEGVRLHLLSARQAPLHGPPVRPTARPRRPAGPHAPHHRDVPIGHRPTQNPPRQSEPGSTRPAAER